MTITIKMMRVAGLSEAQIIRLFELEQQERIATRREQNRKAQQKQRARQHFSADSADGADATGKVQQNQHPRQQNGADNVPSDLEVSKEKISGTSEAEIDLKKQLYQRGYQLLGERSGSRITELLVAKGNNLAAARSALEKAADAANPKDYLAAIIRNGNGSAKGYREANGYVWRSGIPGIM